MFEATNDYRAKACNVSTDFMTKWWNSLTKDDLLSILHDSPEITADTLRKVLKDEQIVLRFSTDYSAETAQANVSFFDKESKEC